MHKTKHYFLHKIEKGALQGLLLSITFAVGMFFGVSIALSTPPTQEQLINALAVHIDHPYNPKYAAPERKPNEI